MDPNSEPTISALLERQISMLGDNLNRRLDEQDRALQEIRRQTTATNGRVIDLEKARERSLGLMTAFRWMPPVLMSTLSAGLTILIMALSGGLH